MGHSLESYLLALKSVGMTSYRYAAILFTFVESCVPEDLFRVWLRNNGALHRDDVGSGIFWDRIQDLLSFLLSVGEGVKRSFSVKYASRLSGVCRAEKNCKKKVEETATTATGLLSGEK